jgi:hypothetical protein
MTDRRTGSKSELQLPIFRAEMEGKWITLKRDVTESLELLSKSLAPSVGHVPEHGIKPVLQADCKNEVRKILEVRSQIRQHSRPKI